MTGDLPFPAPVVKASGQNPVDFGAGVLRFVMPCARMYDSSWGRSAFSVENERAPISETIAAVRRWFR